MDAGKTRILVLSLLTLCSFLDKFGYMEESKILLMEQLSSYINSAVLKGREPHSTVEDFVVKESELSDFLVGKKDVDKFEIVQRNSPPKSFHLLRLDRTEEVKYNSKDSNVENLLCGFAFIFIFSLFFWFVAIYLLSHETPPMYLNESSSLPPFISLICIDFALFAYIAFSFNPKIEKEKVFHVDSVEVNKKDFELISSLKSQSLEYDFNYLFELFCEAYWDSRVNHSEETTKTSKIIVDRIIEKLSIAVESESKEKAMVRDVLDSKWKMTGKEL